jgi:hypothetical protein
LQAFPRPALTVRDRDNANGGIAEFVLSRLRSEAALRRPAKKIAAGLSPDFADQ